MLALIHDALRVYTLPALSVRAAKRTNFTQKKLQRFCQWLMWHCEPFVVWCYRVVPSWTIPAGMRM